MIAIYSRKIDRVRLQRFLNLVIEGELQYKSALDLAMDIHNRMGHGEFYPDKKRVEKKNDPKPVCKCPDCGANVFPCHDIPGSECENELCGGYWPDEG